MTISETIQNASDTLTATSTSPLLDAEVLLGFVLDVKREFFVAHGSDKIETDVMSRFDGLVEERATGVPIPYLTGIQEFYGRSFFVDERVLIPRPETEMMIDAVKRIADERSLTAPRIVDIGSGSGCVAVTLKKELLDSEVYSSDISTDALEVARENAETLGAEVTYFEGDLYGALPEKLRGKLDFIVSNPPYVDSLDIDLADPEMSGLKYEPEEALFPRGGSAFSIIASLIQGAGNWLTEDGSLIIEIGYDQGADALQATQQYFPNHKVEILKDLGGLDRLLVISK